MSDHSYLCEIPFQAYVVDFTGFSTEVGRKMNGDTLTGIEASSSEMMRLHWAETRLTVLLKKGQ